MPKDLQLCKQYEPLLVQYPALVEIKMDGVRAVSVDGRLLSRHLKPLSNVDGIGKLLPKQWVFDGELIASGAGMEAWGHTVSVVHTSAYKLDASRLVYRVFDAMPLAEWKARHCKQPQAARSYKLKEMVDAIGDERVQLVKMWVVHTPGELQKVYKQVLKAGGEGLVVKNPHGLYQFKRSTNWLKMKPVQTCELRCTGVEEGTGRCKGTLGALLLEGGLRVGTGFNDQERDRFWKNPPVGLMVEITFQERTVKGHLRFPSFQRVRIDLA